MVYEPLYHARERATIKFSSGSSCKAKSVTCSKKPWFFFFNKIIIPRALVGYEMIKARRPRWLSIISYPTRASGIIVKYSPTQHHIFFRNWHSYTCTSLFIPITLTWHFEVCVRVCIVIVVLRSVRGILFIHHVFVPYSGFVGPKLQTTNRIPQVKRRSKVIAFSKDGQIDSRVENEVHETTVGVRCKAKLELDAVLQTKTGWKNSSW